MDSARRCAALLRSAHTMGCAGVSYWPAPSPGGARARTGAAKLRELRDRWYQRRLHLKAESLLGDILPGIVGLVHQGCQERSRAAVLAMCSVCAMSRSYNCGTWSDEENGIYVGLGSRRDVCRWHAACVNRSEVSLSSRRRISLILI